MKNALLVHGWADKEEYYNEIYPTASNAHWFPWLTKQLMIRDIHTVAPEMPNGFFPDYSAWKQEFERFNISSETILVGHSCGSGFLLRWLSEANQNVDKVILVAPWLGSMVGDNNYSTEEFDMNFFDFDFDSNMTQKTRGITVIGSTDDNLGVQMTLTFLHERLKDAKHVMFKNKGHFTLKSLGTEEFPELLEEIV